MWIEANGDVGEAAHHDNKYQNASTRDTLVDSCSAGRPDNLAGWILKVASVSGQGHIHPYNGGLSKSPCSHFALSIQYFESGFSCDLRSGSDGC